MATRKKVGIKPKPAASADAWVGQEQDSDTPPPAARAVVEIALEATPAERLAQLEKVIGDNFKAFYAVGKALAEIRDSRLYKELGYSDFHVYCQERWDIGKPYASRLEAAAGVVDNLKALPNGQRFLPANERQVRPLLKLAPELQRQVWEKLIETTPAKSSGAELKISAQRIEEVVAEVTGAPKSGDKQASDGVKHSFRLAEDVGDLLQEQYHRLRRSLPQDKRKAVSVDAIVEALLKRGLDELATQGEQSTLWATLLALAEPGEL